MLNLPLSAAQHLNLEAQGLLHPPARMAAREDVLAAIRRLGALQIDTINVVARSPYLALWSRLGDYDPEWLNQLLAEGAIFEYWGHAASFLAIEDYPFYRRFIQEGRYWHRYKEWYKDHQGEVDPILEFVRQNGAVRSADFERKDGKKGTWWDWKIEKDALEYWFTMGELMIARRERFQRVYDLRERVLPSWRDEQAPALKATHQALTYKTVQCLGIARPAWVADYFRLPKKAAAESLSELETQGLICPVQVEDWSEPAYIPQDHVELAKTAAVGGIKPSYTTLLSPFDSLIWDRSRSRQLFDFDFALECYLPPSKRIYGYYLLSVLHQGKLIGRLDVKAHRKEKFFEVKALYLENGVQVDDDLVEAVAGSLRRCAAWHRTPEVVVQKTAPETLLPLLTRALQA